MNIRELTPASSLRVLFHLSKHKFVPHESGCYVLTTFEGEILYIGLSQNLNRRFGEHRDTKEKCSPTQQGLAFWFYYLPYAANELARLERTWLNDHVSRHGNLPILNKVNSPVR